MSYLLELLLSKFWGVFDLKYLCIHFIYLLIACPLHTFRQVYQPTVVSTRIDTEYETRTVVNTVTNTVVVDARVPTRGTPTAIRLPQGVPASRGSQLSSGIQLPLGSSLVQGVPRTGLSFGEQEQLLRERQQELFRYQLQLQEQALEAEKFFRHENVPHKAGHY